MLALRAQVKSPHPTSPTQRCSCPEPQPRAAASSSKRSPSITCLVLDTSKSPDVGFPRVRWRLSRTSAKRRSAPSTWDSPQNRDHLGLAWAQLGAWQMAEVSPWPTCAPQARLCSPRFPMEMRIEGLLPLSHPFPQGCSPSSCGQRALVSDSSVPSSPHPRAHGLPQVPQALPGRTGVTSLRHRPGHWLPFHLPKAPLSTAH